MEAPQIQDITAQDATVSEPNPYHRGWPLWVRDQLTEDYFLTEWSRVPCTQERIFEHFCLMTFQLGLWWRTVLNKREALANFFNHYSIDSVAGISDQEIRRATTDPGLIRNIYKLRACRDNARVLIEHGVDLPEVFAQYLPTGIVVSTYQDLPRTHPATDSICGYLKKCGLRYIGPVGTCSVAQALGLISVKSHQQAGAERPLGV